MKICLRLDWKTPENILLNSAGEAKLDKSRDAHLSNHMIKNFTTRARAVPLFKTIIPKCEKYINHVLYKGAMIWN